MQKKEKENYSNTEERLKDYGKRNLNNLKGKKKRKLTILIKTKTYRDIRSQLLNKKKKDFSENTCHISKIFFQKVF